MLKKLRFTFEVSISDLALLLAHTDKLDVQLLGDAPKAQLALPAPKRTPVKEMILAYAKGHLEFTAADVAAKYEVPVKSIYNGCYRLKSIKRLKSNPNGTLSEAKRG